MAATNAAMVVYLTRISSKTCGLKGFAAAYSLATAIFGAIHDPALSN